MSKNKKSANASNSIKGSGSKGRSESASGGNKRDQKQPDPPPGRAARETVESIVVAIILAFLFRAFVAEAFVIPTGSMANTLMGNHKDVECPQCGYQYQGGASDKAGPVLAITCPICRFDRETATRVDFGNGYSGFEPIDSESKTHTGDRILVSKFAYDLADPSRWDVFVFKFPGNAKQNYIKRLIGLPNETVRISHGDVYTKKKGDDKFVIARKAPQKLQAMLQIVDDTNHQPQALLDAGWPTRWQTAGNASGNTSWAPADGKIFANAGSGTEVDWIAYQHFVPNWSHWKQLEEGGSFTDQIISPQLITDYYAYNDVDSSRGSDRTPLWVGDLAMEATVKVTKASGKLHLQLIEGGSRYTCTIDVATGKAQLSINEGSRNFSSLDGQNVQFPSADTGVKGVGTYDLRFANVDGQLTLWVDDDAVAFSEPTTYHHLHELQTAPQATAQDPGDMAPARIGSEGCGVEIDQIRILRDIYYIAASRRHSDDYSHGKYISSNEIRQAMTNPASWPSTPVFEARGFVDFELGEDQFFPCGDNSPQSLDGRVWNTDDSRIPLFVDRELLTGKAVFIYWPHMVHGFVPNFGRMQFIR